MSNKDSKTKILSTTQHDNLLDKTGVTKKYRAIEIKDNKFEEFQDDKQVTADIHGEAPQTSLRSSTEASNKIDTIILVHGWNQSRKDMTRLEEKLKRDSVLTQLKFYKAEYPYTTSFIDSSKIVRDDLRRRGFNDKSSLVVGYSMGGVLARQMYCDGYRFKKLVTICSPHQGLGFWIPTPEPGSMSLAPLSPALMILNSNPDDIDKRKDYSMFGVTYRDIRGHFNDDGVVPISSATGESLGGSISRHQIQLNYNWLVSPFDDPHSQGWKADNIDQVVMHIKSLIIEDHSKPEIRKITLLDNSKFGPSLATLDNNLLMGWVGNGNNFLNFIQSTDGINFNNKRTITNETSKASLGITSFKSKYIVAWTGMNNNISVMQSNDGINWGNKVVLSEQSESAPSITVYKNQVYLAWRGLNNNLNIIRSSNGLSWGQKITLPETTNTGPSIAEHGSALYLAWSGTNNNFLNIIKSNDGSNFPSSSKYTSTETTTSRPHLQSYKGNLVYMWQGVGNNLINIMESANGSNWSRVMTFDESCTDGPVFVSLKNEFVCGWTGNEQLLRLNSRIFSYAGLRTGF